MRRVSQSVGADWPDSQIGWIRAKRATRAVHVRLIGGRVALRPLRLQTLLLGGIWRNGPGPRTEKTMYRYRLFAADGDESGEDTTPS
jgi:hypothetical protein